ncbi:MAG: T9SS type A sorting domain-containing protein [Bacteroidales bacterium]
MKKMVRLFSPLFLLLLFTGALQGQGTVPATGGTGIGSGGTVTYTVGQVAFSTLQWTNGFIIQGVQQPFEISTITGIQEETISLDYLVYPNPTSGILRLVISAPDPEKYRLQLFDQNGILLLNNKITESETEVSMEKLLPSIYFIRILRGSIEVKLFKIVKK